MAIEQDATDGEGVKRCRSIIEKMERVQGMIGDETHLLHAVRAFRGIEDFVSRRVDAFSVSERRALRLRLDGVAAELEGLSDHDRERTEADKALANIRRATETLQSREPHHGLFGIRAE